MSLLAVALVLDLDHVSDGVANARGIDLAQRMRVRR